MSLQMRGGGTRRRMPKNAKRDGASLANSRCVSSRRTHRREASDAPSLKRFCTCYSAASISGRPVIPDKMAFADGAKSILFPNVCYFSHLLHIDIKINYVSLLND